MNGGAPVPARLRRAARARGRVATVALVAVVASFAAPAQTPDPRGAGAGAAAPAAARRFMVAASHPLAVDAGYAILAQGGNAVDAAIAVQLVLGLVEPQSSGLGGGAFMLVHDARQRRLFAYDGRETAPAAARPDRFLDADGKPLAFHAAVVGGRSVGVPGTVALLFETHRRHGALPWAKLFAPAIALAEQGFPVSPRLHRQIASERFLEQPRARRYFHDAAGEPLASGALLRNPGYAATLRKLAAGGARAFYEGDIARDVVATANSHPTHPGDLTEADLAAYRVRIREPVCGGYRAFKVCGMPLPSSGGPTVLQALTMLETWDLSAMGAESLWSVHFIAEAERLAYADRSVYMADPDFVAPPAGLLDRRYLAGRAREVRADASSGRALPGLPPPAVEAPPPHADRAAARGPASAAASRGVRGRTPTVPYGVDQAAEFPSTAHVSIVDAQGNAVAMTTTIEDTFGSRLMTESGFLLNNELTDFSFVPVADGKPVANRVEPGKRPRSSMAPTIVYDAGGRVHMVVGSPGGTAIIEYVVKTLVAVLDWGMDPQAAAAASNFGSRNGPTELERGSPLVALAPKLRALGHDVRLIEMTSGVQAIVRTRAGWIGGADPRREGAVRGE